MRYQTFETYASGLRVWHESLRLVKQLADQNPLIHTPPGRAVHAGLELGLRMTQRYEKQDFGIKEVFVNNKRVGVYERIELEKPFCNLMHFKRRGLEESDKVLLVAPLSGHHATLTRGTVEALLPDHEVYITDWLDAREIPMEEGEFSFDNYVDYLVDFIEHLGKNTHVVAICQPTVQALIATAVLAERKSSATPKSLTLMAGPIDCSKNPTRVNTYAQEHSLDWFRNFAIMTVPKGYPGEGRRVYPGFLQLGGFLSMNMDGHVKKFFNFYQNLMFGEEEDADRFRAFYDEYMAVLDIPAEFYLETIERVFHHNEIARNATTYHGKPVDFLNITDTALLTVEGANDDICGIGQTEAAQDVCKNIPKKKRKHHLQEGAGHYGIFSGSKFRMHIRPLITEFINKYS
ncbi:polyhydroxyalkanoate depolymerase [Simiduia agarivorans]|uniref:Polyhydroxyalkanoate depolymerase n=1 Tax=Simiduia agarivorans (strain DSM 21679 / JCM 13881 / BCRC 17597 / SA1) TaxID=1117647 RepID=K4KMD4_SIMAS|nr:polyhydroxyalkanoate depolymerase [Simiduia agarivorans]AFV00162.1 polyhydroxyalkanoate depolymerase [Simiduia agarivorans SA1 = DSM 21679]